MCSQLPLLVLPRKKQSSFRKNKTTRAIYVKTKLLHNRITVYKCFKKAI